MYKGFLNEPDSNNCFINTILQVLFHQPLFREAIQNTKILHSPKNQDEMNNCGCIICSLKTIEQELRNAGSALSSQSIRNVLLSTNHVQLQEMGDAIETFEDIAELLHSSSSSSLFSDNSFLLKNELSFPNCSTHCIAHSVLFGIIHTISSTCPICHTHTKRDEILWHQPLIISQLINSSYIQTQSNTIVSLIQSQIEYNHDVITCDTCNKQGITTKIPIQDVVSHYPPILAISCVFTTSNQSSSILEKVYHLFTSSSFSSYSLHAFVYYHYYHYVSICLEGNNMTSCWVEYNDNQRTIFHSTEEMIDHCIQSMALPVLLFYSINQYDSFDPSSSMDCIHENQDYSLYQFTMNLAHSVKNFLTPQTNVEFPVVCPFCSSTVNVQSDELICPSCHHPLP